MSDLIGRLENATGPDHKLDCEIALATGWRREVVRWEEGEDVHWYEPSGKIAGGYCLFFTLRIDDALTLVPSHCQWTLEPDAAWVRWMGKKDVEEAQGFFFRMEGKATAIALCIAALKARRAHPQNEPLSKGGRYAQKPDDSI